MNLDRFYNILATIQYSRLWKSAIMDQFVTFRKRVYKESDPDLSLSKLMVSHDLPHSRVTNQIAFDQQDLYSSPEFERAMDRRWQVLDWKPQTPLISKSDFLKVRD